MTERDTFMPWHSCAHGTPAGRAPAAADWRPADPVRDPCREVGAALIVLEGPRRILWERRGPACWRPARLWPSPAERRGLADHIGAGRPLVVVLEELPCAVEVLPEELRRAPGPLAALARPGGDGPAAIDIPPLDWLPEPIRARGRAFAACGPELIRANPELRLSALVFEPAGDRSGPVRFAVATGGRPIRDTELALLA
ncbi:hypothetical protein [Actinacidiphila sp. ITFR-21]|uniref:hypothetical protein n=1 Tax=Actinacidiphila sp. ITFR-21 TaxID=3075199 RepID=UPI002889B676|nr:hypothetical protein [Streptomyces sp. ITFR-21]WNI15075.1 hypothetical protein RLT57_05690 [Streptomyces sp. ITFR-21]